jgi:hypothetical protein
MLQTIVCLLLSGLVAAGYAVGACFLRDEATFQADLWAVSELCNAFFVDARALHYLLSNFEGVTESFRGALWSVYGPAIQPTHQIELEGLSVSVTEYMGTRPCREAMFHACMGTMLKEQLVRYVEMQLLLLPRWY